VLGPIAGHLALVTDGNQVDFISLETKKLVNSIPSSANVRYYPGCGALYEFDTNARALTRISVPDGKRGTTFSLPEKVYLQAIALGEERSHPLTLFFEGRHGEQNSQFGNYTFSTWESDRTILAVNSETLSAGGWMQPQVWTEKPDLDAMRNALMFFGTGNDFPKRVVGSRDGSMLILPNHLLVLSPRYSVAAPYPNQTNRFGGPYTGSDSAPTGSITGILAADAHGTVYRNGLKEERVNERIVTSCGRYELSPLLQSGRSGPSFEIRSLEGRRPLFRLNRLAVLKMDLGSSDLPFASNDIRMVGDNGPLLIRPKSGHVLQFVDFDIPRLARELDPMGFHVTSQPMPCVVEGGKYEYQIQVNNPSAVSTYRLRGETRDATVSPAGLLTFSAPQNIRGPLQVDLSVEIVGRNGITVLHEFPLVVLPRRVPDAPAKKTPGRGL
jgi:hypothetical protein